MQEEVLQILAVRDMLVVCLVIVCQEVVVVVTTLDKVAEQGEMGVEVLLLLQVDLATVEVE